MGNPRAVVVEVSPVPATRPLGNNATRRLGNKKVLGQQFTVYLERVQCSLVLTRAVNQATVIEQAQNHTHTHTSNEGTVACDRENGLSELQVQVACTSQVAEK